MSSFKKLSLSLCFFLVLSGLGFSFMHGDSLPPAMEGINADIGGDNTDVIRFYHHGSMFDGDVTYNEKFIKLIIDPRNYVVVAKRGRNDNGDCATLFGIQWKGDPNTGVYSPKISTACVYQVQDGNLQVSKIEYTEGGVLIRFRTGRNKLADGMGDCHSGLFYRISDNKWFFYGRSQNLDSVCEKTSSEVTTIVSASCPLYVKDINHVTQ